MLNLIPLAYLLSVILVDLILLLGIIRYNRKLRVLITKKRSEIKSYSHDIVIGLVSGIIVIVIDKIATMVTTNVPYIDFSSIWSIIGSIIGILIIVLSISLFLILAVIYIIYIGFNTNSKLEKKN